jgi:exopolysaccharide production protein ExoQ
MTLAERDALLIISGTAAATLIVIAAIEPSSLVAIAALPAVVALSVLAWGALRGDRITTLAFLFATVFLLQAVFRVREYEDKDVDFQVLLKIGLWLTVLLIAAVHARRWLAAALNPVNLPWILFLGWLFATALVSPAPLYTAVSAFTILACVMFCAYLFSTFDRVDIFAAVVASIAAFSFVSIVVYFAIPEFGHYVYWQDGERYLSPRLAGIAGSANNMALIASFGIVAIGLFAREFHRLHPLFVPAAALMIGAALLMTNSRAAMAVTALVLFASYAFTWRRAHIAIFVVSAGLIALAAALPIGSDAIFKAVSRSGDIGEITSFTGRTDIWYGVLKLAEAKPWMGYGYASSVFVLPQHESEIGFLTSHAHNLPLQLLLTTGWIGVALFVLSILGAGLRAVILRDRVLFAMLLFVLLNGVTEASGFTTLANICTFAFAIAIAHPGQQVTYAHHRPYQRRFS